MVRSRCVCVWILLAAAVCVGGQGNGRDARQKAGAQVWRNSFPVDKANLSDTGRNPYFILEPGYRLTLIHDGDTGVIL